MMALPLLGKNFNFAEIENRFIMKKILLILAFSLCAWGMANAQTAQVSKEYVAAVEKMMKASRGLDAAQQIMTQMFAVFKAQFTEVPAEAWEKMEQEMSTSMERDFVEMLAPIYQKYLTLEDMNAIIAFYESPAGKKLAAAQTGIAADSFQAGQQWGQQIGQKVQEQLKAEGYLQ